MKKALAFSLLFALAEGLFAQLFIEKARLLPAEKAVEMALPTVADAPFFAFSLVVFSEHERLFEFARAGDDGQFSAFESLPHDHHAADFSEEKAAENRHPSGLVFFEKGTKKVKIRLADGQKMENPLELEAHFFAPKAAEKVAGGDANNGPKVAGGDANNGGLAIEKSPETGLLPCDCPQPAHLKRAVWCPTCPYAAAPTATTVSHLIVHHSAGTATATDWSAVVAAIWDYHVNSNGWADIGYNWLIAPDGQLFEGRADNVQGAHFCGYNGGTMGACLLGTFTSQPISAAAQKTLVDLLAWKSCVRNLDPLGTAFHSPSGKDLARISGHRDGCATECPGDALYPTLPMLRDSVAARLAACQMPVSTTFLTEKAAARVFPNPAENGFFWLEIDEKRAESGLFQLFSADGKRVVEQKIDGEKAGLFRFETTVGGLLFWRFGAASGKIWMD